MFGGSGPSAPPPVATPPQKTDPAIQEAANQARLLARKRGGRAATLLTGGGGRGRGDTTPLGTPSTATLGGAPPTDMTGLGLQAF